MEKVKFLPGFLAFLALVGNLMFDLSSYGNLPWGIWVFLVLMVIQSAILYIENATIKNTRPNVITDGFDREIVKTTYSTIITKEGGTKKPFPGVIVSLPRQTITSLTTDAQSAIVERYLPAKYSKEIEEGDTFERFYIIFRNVKAGGKNIENTKELHAKITFHGEKCISHEKPRWRNKPTPDKPQEAVILKASSKPEQLYLVIRKEDSKTLYVFNDDSYEQNSFNPINENLRLKNKKHYIHIVLSSQNIKDDVSTWVLLTNRGKGKDPEFRIIEKPCELDSEK